MIKWLVKLLKGCDHDFQNIGDKIDKYYDNYGVKYWRRYRLYCPKCDLEKLVDANRYDIEELKRKVKKNYYK